MKLSLQNLTARLLPGAALALAFSAQAAPVLVAVSATGEFGGVVATDVGCTTAFTLATTLTCAPDGSADAQLYASARADPGGRLRGLAEVQQTTAGTGTLATATASLTAARVFFRPLLADRTVRVRLTLDGTQSVDYDSATSDGTAAASAVTFIRYNIRREGGSAPADFDELLVRRALLDYGPYEQGFTGTQRTVRGVEGAFSEVAGFTAAPLFEFELLAGTSFFDFTFNFATNAFIRAGAAGRVATSYFRTASIDGFQFLDGAGNDVTAETGLSFTPGEQYGRVAEPGVPALAAAAFSLLALQRRRTRRGGHVGT